MIRNNKKSILISLVQWNKMATIATSVWRALAKGKLFEIFTVMAGIIYISYNCVALKIINELRPLVYTKLARYFI